jgi:glycosyltransferase involved in cell wall biosynthesis
VLAAPGDAKTIANAVEQLLDDENLRQRLGQNAAKDAKKRFDLERQVNNYLDWYKELFMPIRNKVLVTGAGVLSGIISFPA